MENKAEPLESLSKNLFTASEAIREALDTIDLEDVKATPEQIAYLEEAHTNLERLAKAYQKKARRQADGQETKGKQKCKRE